MRVKRTFSTEADLAKLTALDGKDTIYSDARMPGLQVRVSVRTGRKVFMLEYRPPGRRNATKRILDEVATLKEARGKALELKTDLNKGIDLPEPEPLPAPAPVITVKYIAEQYKLVRQPTPEIWRCIELRVLPHFGRREAISIRAFEVSSWHAGMTKTVHLKDENGKITGKEQVAAPHTADRMLDIFKALMNWAERQELIPRNSNPCDFVDRNYSQLDTEREYEWEDRELARLADVLNHYQERAVEAHHDGYYAVNIRNPNGSIAAHMPSAWSILAIRFLIITGVRKSEAIKLRWEQVKEDRQIIEWARNSRRKETKALGRNQRVMLRAITEPLEDILRVLKRIRVVGNPYVFVGENRQSHLKEITRVWYRIRNEARLRKSNGDRPRLHDLRHFYGQMAADAGLHEKQIMALMGHSTTRMSARHSKYGREARSIMAETVANRIITKLPPTS